MIEKKEKIMVENDERSFNGQSLLFLGFKFHHQDEMPRNLRLTEGSLSLDRQEIHFFFIVCFHMS